MAFSKYPSKSKGFNAKSTTLHGHIPMYDSSEGDLTDSGARMMSDANGSFMQMPDGSVVRAGGSGGSVALDSKMIHVSSNIGNDSNNGSIGSPKSTLAGALSAVSVVGNINIAPGSYNIGQLSVTKQNMNICGQGNAGASNVELVGTVTANAARIRLSNLFFAAGSEDCFVWNDTTGGHHLQGVHASTGLIGVMFKATSAARGFSNILACDFGGSVAPSNIVLDDLSSGSAILFLSMCSNARISIGTGWTVYVYACPAIQITRSAGNVLFMDSVNINAILTSQAQLSAILADVSPANDGFYICDFSSPSVGARNDILLKLSNGVATSVKVHRPYLWCPATIPVLIGSAFETYAKSAGGWRRVAFV